MDILEKIKSCGVEGIAAKELAEQFGYSTRCIWSPLKKTGTEW